MFYPGNYCDQGLRLVQISKKQSEDNQTFDFISKVSISYKEARETIYWIKLLQATAYLSDQEASGLLNDAEELCKILAKILITHKSRIAKHSNS